MAYDFTDPNFDWDKWTQEQFGAGSDFAQQFTTPAPDFTNVALPSLETPAYQQQIQEQVLKDIESTKQPSYFSTGGGLGNIGKIFGAVLAVASLAIPGIGEIIGAAILGESAATVGAAVGLTATQVSAAVGASALSAATTVASGGSVEDVIKNAASAGIASGLNVGVGGGVPGAVAGSAAGTLIKGGDVSQIVSNVIAAGVGAGVQDVSTNPDAGKIIGTAARTYIASGGNIDQTLLNTAASAIGTLDKPTTFSKTTTAQPAEGAAPFKYGNDTYQELEDGTAKVTTQSGNVRILSADTFNEIKQDYAADVATGAAPAGPVIPPQTVAETAPVSPTVTGTDLIKQVAAQPTPTVDPKTFQQVLVQGQGANVANVAPVETTVPSATVPSAKTVATPTPEQPFPTPTVTPEKEAEVVTDVPVTRPDTTAGLVPPQADLGTVNVGYVTDPFVDIAPPTEPTRNTTLDTVKINYPVDPFVDISPPPTEPTPVATEPVAPSAAKPVELQQVTVSEKREPSPTITDIVAKTMEPPPAPAPVPAPEVKTEEPKKEEAPKKESKKLYPTVTSVPPPARPGRQPIITGASPARLLADALAAYRPAGAIEGEESGKERQNVWNEKSLRLKDALGL